MGDRKSFFLVAFGIIAFVGCKPSNNVSASSSSSNQNIGENPGESSQVVCKVPEAQAQQLGALLAKIDFKMELGARSTETYRGLDSPRDCDEAELRKVSMGDPLLSAGLVRRETDGFALAGEEWSPGMCGLSGNECGRGVDTPAGRHLYFSNGAELLRTTDGRLLVLKGV